MSCIILLFRSNNYNLHLYPESGTCWNGNPNLNYGWGPTLENARWQVGAIHTHIPYIHSIVGIRI